MKKLIQLLIILGSSALPLTLSAARLGVTNNSNASITVTINYENPYKKTNIKQNSKISTIKPRKSKNIFTGPRQCTKKIILTSQSGKVIKRHDFGRHCRNIKITIDADGKNATIEKI